MAAERSIYCGSFVHCLSPSELDICSSAAIGVDEHGTIAFIERDSSDGSAAAKKHGWNKPKIVTADASSFFFPGFIGAPTDHFTPQS
jgi:guanine deaminase